MLRRTFCCSLGLLPLINFKPNLIQIAEIITDDKEIKFVDKQGKELTQLISHYYSETVANGCVKLTNQVWGKSVLIYLIKRTNLQDCMIITSSVKTGMKLIQSDTMRVSLKWVSIDHL